jgi:sigma-B regulation protein RsbU (phosphoserine phosphatase)
MPELQRQLFLLRDLKRHLLPRNLPELDGWDVVVHHAPGAWPGGDYYDFLPLPDGRVVVFLAGASDQGAPSTAMAAMVRVTMHSCPLTSGMERLPFCPMHEAIVQPPHIILGHLNRVLAENSLEEQFLTAICGVLDPVDGNFHFANAGHPLPLWWHANHNAVEPVCDAVGLPLGIDARASYHHRRIQLQPRDLLLLYTDGLAAAQDGQGQVFGRGRIEDAIRIAASGSAESVKASVASALTEFLQGEPAPDDVTFLVIQRSDLVA